MSQMFLPAEAIALFLAQEISALLSEIGDTPRAYHCAHAIEGACRLLVIMEFPSGNLVEALCIFAQPLEERGTPSSGIAALAIRRLEDNLRRRSA